jgi:hypothetical protein
MSWREVRQGAVKMQDRVTSQHFWTRVASLSADFGSNPVERELAVG